MEEPLEIRIQYGAGSSRETRRVAVTMRTPGNDFELAAGFLFSENILTSREQVRDISYCVAEGPQQYNVLSVRLRDSVHFDPSLLTRNFYTSSSCGVCGKASIESVEVQGCEALSSDTLQMPASLVSRLPDLLFDGQTGFRKTGGLHAAGLFDSQGRLEVLREDVGRHNAVDKVIGHGFLDGLQTRHGHALVVSGRTSFEIIQKALMAGIPMVVAVGAPSSLAVDLAREFNQTLVGFARGGEFNLYSGRERVLDWEDEGKRLGE